MDNREFYEIDNWVNPNILFTYNKEITEYDIASAGLSISKELHLLPDDKISHLFSLSKEKRNIEIGLLQREDKEFQRNLQNGFIMFRKKFCEDNKLERDDVISIKRDAIFPTKICRHTEYGAVKFRRKKQYSSYARISRRLEIYYSEFGTDVKGIDDERINLHRDFMLSFINGWFHRVETLGIPQAMKYLRKTYDSYKRKELPLGWYRRFDAQSLFETSDEVYGIVNIDNVIINYNIGAVFIKLAKLGV